MARTDLQALFLGTLGDLDGAKNMDGTGTGADLVGRTYDGDIRSGSLTINGADRDSDGDIDVRDNLNLTWDGRTSNMDSAFEYRATLTLTDGSAHQVDVILAQDSLGRVYVTAADQDDAEILAGEVASIRLDAQGGDDDDSGDLCLAASCLVSTPGGPRPAGALREGDRVVTLDGGARPVVWAGRSVGEGGKATPVRISAGALGPGTPARDLVVSPQHRVLIRSAIARRIAGTAEVLVPAVRLVGQPGIVRDAGDAVTYIHLLLDRHHLILSEGAWTESLLLAPLSLRLVGPAARSALLRRFPSEILGRSRMAPARPVLTGPQTRRLLARHRMHDRALVADVPPVAEERVQPWERAPDRMRKARQPSAKEARARSPAERAAAGHRSSADCADA